MRSYTLTHSNTIHKGIRLESTHSINSVGEEAYGILFATGEDEHTLIPAEEKVSNHLVACTDALKARADGDFNHSKLLGEESSLKVTSEDAAKALEEIGDGWFVDHLTVDPADNLLMNASYHSREKRCLLLISPELDAGGKLTFSSNLPSGEGMDGRGRVVRTYHPIKQAAGLTQVFSDGKQVLLKMDANASFRVARSGCRDGWKDLLITWNGRVLRKHGRKPPRDQKRRTRAA